MILFAFGYIISIAYYKVSRTLRLQATIFGEKMAVKIQNEANIRKAKRWNEEDDAALALMLRKKIRETGLAVRDAKSPYERERLKARRDHYKKMARKVQNGSYNGDILFSEMQAAADLRAQESNKFASYSTVGGAKTYLNSYEDMDFDYENYFRKRRYFGIFLPIIMFLLTAVFLTVFIIGAILPTETKINLYDSTGIKTDALFTFKVGEGTNDFRIKNDGNWPDGNWPVNADGEEERLEQGVPFVKNGVTPEYVSVHADLGMTAINISAFDVIKAWFRTPMLASTRLDFLENNANFQGPSWYYSKFFDSNDGLQIERNADGQYDIISILRYLGGYAGILCLVAAFLLGIIALITNIIRLFTYTSRKVHLVNILAFIFALLAVVMPALLLLESTDFGAAFQEFFVFDEAAFFDESGYRLMMNPIALIPAAVMLVNMLLPLMFKNKLKKRPTYVPKGNKARRNYGY